jgi:hypothetical protein
MNFRNALSMLAFGLMAAQPALAAREVSISTGGFPALGCSESNATGALISTSCSNGGAAASASGFANYRNVGVSASTFAEQVFDPFSPRTTAANASASARMYDYLTVSSQGQSGPAMLSFSIVISRDLEFFLRATEITTHTALSQGGAGADFRAVLEIAGTRFFHLQQDFEEVRLATTQAPQRQSNSAAAINNVPVSTALGTFNYSVPIVLGREFFVEMALRADVSSSGFGTAGGDGTLNSLNSFDWGGIQGVTVDGQPVDFAVTSQSGTDWTSPVPELPTMALLIGGLGVVLRRAARGSASRPRQMISK